MTKENGKKIMKNTWSVSALLDGGEPKNHMGKRSNPRDIIRREMVEKKTEKNHGRSIEIVPDAAEWEKVVRVRPRRAENRPRKKKDEGVTEGRWSGEGGMGPIYQNAMSLPEGTGKRRERPSSHEREGAVEASTTSIGRMEKGGRPIDTEQSGHSFRVMKGKNLQSQQEAGKDSLGGSEKIHDRKNFWNWPKGDRLTPDEGQVIVLVQEKRGTS